MAAATGVSVEEYLHTNYEPDMEYVNGQLVERNVGEYFHSLLQSLIGVELLKRAGGGFRAFRILGLSALPSKPSWWARLIPVIFFGELDKNPDA